MKNILAVSMSALLMPALSNAEPWAADLENFRFNIRRINHFQNPQIKAEDAALAHLVEEASPAIVMLSVKVKPEARRPQQRMPKEFEEFFKQFGPLAPEQGESPGQSETPKEQPGRSKGAPTSLGSGFIIDYNGRKVIITNSHVVEDSVDGVVAIRFADDAERRGKVLAFGKSDVLDLAIVTVDDDCAGCATVKLGDSGALKRMHRVVAIGAPWGMTQTVTMGVVSHANRQGSPDLVAYHIQTDAAINRGNSGGPLLNTDGEVIGVNTMIMSDTGGSIGLGFAIPSSEIKKMLDHYTRTGVLVASPSRMGISLGLDETRQIEFGEPVEDSPAQRAGLQKGDILLAVDGRPAPKDVGEFVKRVKLRGVGETLRLTVKRGEQILELSVVLEAAQ